MGRSHGVQQEPPSDPLVVHLLENRRSKQMFENVAKCIHLSSINPHTRLCHWNLQQISGENWFPFTLLMRGSCGEGYLMNAEQNKLGTTVRNEAMFSFIFAWKMGLWKIFFCNLQNFHSLFIIQMAITMKLLTVEGQMVCWNYSFYFKSFNHSQCHFHNSSTIFFWLVSIFLVPKIVSLIYFRICSAEGQPGSRYFRHLASLGHMDSL